MVASASETRQVAEAWFAALDRDDIPSALALLAEDVDWEHLSDTAGSTAGVPWLGTFHGASNVRESFRLRGEAIEVLGYKPADLAVDGNQAVATVHEQGRVKATGRTYEIAFAAWIRVTNGTIVRWASYGDPSAIIAAVRGDMKSRLLDAVERDGSDDARALLNQGADPNARDMRTGLTALMIAACHGQAAIVRALLDAGADPLTADTRTGMTALHKACQSGSAEVARLLIEAGAFIDAPSPTIGHTAVMDALWYKSPALVRYLVAQQANVNLGTHYGFTFADHLKFETDVNATNKEEMEEMAAIFAAYEQATQEAIARQTVMAATVKGDLEGVAAAIAAGADVNAVYPHVNSFQDGHTPLLVAARDGHTAIVEALLKAGADVRATDWVFRAMPIHKATYTGNVEIVKLLMSHPDIDLDFQGPINGYTPLHDALWHGYTECAMLLIEEGARLDLRGHDGKLPLDVATDTFGPDGAIVGLIRERMAAASPSAPTRAS